MQSSTSLVQQMLSRCSFFLSRSIIPCLKQLGRKTRRLFFKFFKLPAVESCQEMRPVFQPAKASSGRNLVEAKKKEMFYISKARSCSFPGTDLRAAFHIRATIYQKVQPKSYNRSRSFPLTWKNDDKL